MIDYKLAMTLTKEREEKEAHTLFSLLSEKKSMKEKADLLSHFEPLYERIATSELYLNDDCDVAKLAFFKAAVASYASHTCYIRGIEKGVIDDSDYNNPTMGRQIPNCFFWAILSDNQPFLKESVENLAPTSKWENIYALNIAYAVKFLMSDKLDTASEYVDKACNSLLVKKYPKEKSYSFVLKGIINNKRGLIEEGINHKINVYKREYSNTIVSWVCLEATALAKLAKNFGFVVPAYDHPLIHKGLLANSEFINYEDNDVELFKSYLNV